MNLASMSVMLMQVMPKGRTEASSVIISSRERMSLSASAAVVGVVVALFSGFGLGTKREWTAGQLSTI